MILKLPLGITFLHFFEVLFKDSPEELSSAHKPEATTSTSSFLFSVKNDWT